MPDSCERNVSSAASLCPYCDLPGRLMGSGVRYVCDNRHYWPTENGFCTCDGDVRIDTSCGVREHRERARAQRRESVTKGSDGAE